MALAVTPPLTGSSMRFWNVLIIFSLSIAFFSMSGCSTKTSLLNQEILKHTETIGFVTSNRVNQIRIIDRKQYSSGILNGVGTALGASGGAAGGLVGGLIKGSVALDQGKQSRAISEAQEQIESLNFHAQEAGINETLVEKIEKKLSGRFRLVELNKSVTTKDDIQLYFKIRYNYGLGKYKGDLYSVLLDGMLFIFDYKTDKLLLTKHISSDSVFLEQNSLKTFTENDGVMFKTNLVNAIDGFAELIADGFAEK